MFFHVFPFSCVQHSTENEINTLSEPVHLSSGRKAQDIVGEQQGIATTLTVEALVASDEGEEQKDEATKPAAEEVLDAVEVAHADNGEFIQYSGSPFVDAATEGQKETEKSIIDELLAPEVESAVSVT